MNAHRPSLNFCLLFAHARGLLTRDSTLWPQVQRNAPHDTLDGQGGGARSSERLSTRCAYRREALGDARAMRYRARSCDRALRACTPRLALARDRQGSDLAVLAGVVRVRVVRVYEQKRVRFGRL